MQLKIHSVSSSGTVALPLNSPVQTPTLTFAELGALVQAVVVVLVLGAEGCVVVIDEGVIPHVATVVPQEEAVAVVLVAQNKVAVLGVARVALPVLSGTAEP